MKSYSNIGKVYYCLGNYPEALKNDFASLKIEKEIEIITTSGNYNMPISDAKEFCKLLSLTS